jgi:aminomethyltransferase
MLALKHSPLHAFHLAHGARMVPFAGWEMPVQYGSILEEHRAVRGRAGLFDVSHMGEVTVRGPQALAFLNHLLTNDLARAADGRGVYSPMCYEDGGVVDDLIAYRRSADDWFICINAGNTEKDVEWITGQAVGFDCTVQDVSADWGQLALQGPAASAILGRLAAGVSDIPRFGIAAVTVAGMPCRVARTGYTGEDGFEIYAPVAATERLAGELLAAGQADGLVLCGLGARDSLRLEAGYPLYGHELSADIDPLTAGLGWTVKFAKAGDFVGRVALTRIRDAGPPRQVVYFRVDGRRIARTGDLVLQGTETVGRVLSGSMSPILDAPIGSTIIKREALAGGLLEVELRGRRATIHPARPPLHKSA